MTYKKKKFQDAWFDHERPVFDSSIGYLMLIDAIAKFASGYCIVGDIYSYFQCLESLFVEIYPIIHSRFDGMPDDLKKARKEAKAVISEITSSNRPSEFHLDTIKRYHILLNSYMHKTKLRLRTTDDIPAVMKT